MVVFYYPADAEHELGNKAVDQVPDDELPQPPERPSSPAGTRLRDSMPLALAAGWERTVPSTPREV
jgi:hypothetical protein